MIKGKLSLMWRAAIAMVLVLSFSLVMAVPVAAADLTPAVVPVDDTAGATTDYSITFTPSVSEATDVTIDFSAFGVTSTDMVLSAVSTTIADYAFGGFTADPEAVVVDDSAKTIVFSGGTTTAAEQTITNAVAGTGLVITNDQDAETQNVTISTTTDTGTQSLTIEPAAPSHLVVTGTATMVVGGTNALTIGAYDEYDNLCSSGANIYQGDKDLTFSGPGTAPDGVNIPTVTDKIPSAVEVGDLTTITFTAGESSVGGLLTAYKAEETTVDVTDETIDSFTNTGWDLDLFVDGINLDSLYYHTGGTVSVTLGDTSAATTGTTLIVASGDIPVDDVEVALTETGADTGIFTGTFTLVNTSPAPGELVVGEGSTITVTYASGDDGSLNTATVDNVSPVFAPVDPVTGPEFCKDDEEITLSVDLDKAGYTLTADFSSIDSGYAAADVDVVDDTDTTYTITYTITESNTKADGEYTIPVTAEDDAGNSATCAAFSTTLDNTAPLVTDAAADPFVLQPDEATNVTFTTTVTDEGSGVTTVTIDLSSLPSGSATQAMTEEDPTEAPGIYTYTWTGLTVTEEDDYDLTITATDTVDNANTTENITLRVIADVTAPVIESTEVEYPVGFESARVGDDVIITAVVTDDLAGVDTVTIDATAIGLTDAEALTLTDENTYSATLTVQAGTTVGTKTLTIVATDYADNSSDIEVTVEVTLGLTAYNIGLSAGWNLISLPLIPDDASIDVVLSGVGDISSVYYWYNDGTSTGWQSYVPGSGGTLTTMEDGKAYFIYMTGADTLTITGTAMPAPPATPPTYDVYAGWNFIGFKSVENMANEVYLNTLITSGEKDYSILYGYDNTTGYFRVSPEPQTHGGADPGDMEVGYGYWLWLTTSSGTITP